MSGIHKTVNENQELYQNTEENKINNRTSRRKQITFHPTLLGSAMNHRKEDFRDTLKIDADESSMGIIWTKLLSST